jgi:rhamnosyltransferase
MTHANPRASVLIRTKNEERQLGSTLEAVFAQSTPVHEVLVIDSESTDATVRIAERFPVDVMRLRADGWSYPKALNAGARRATGDILVCLSAHCRPVTDAWLCCLLQHFADPSVAGAWGDELAPGATIGEGTPTRQEPGEYGPEYRFFGLSNANSAIRRTVWEEFKFDESIPAAEDKAWALQVLRHGYSLVFDPRAAVWHPRGSFAQEYRRSRAIHDGFKVLYPELYASPSGHAARLVKTLQHVVLAQLAKPQPRELWRLARRLPTSVSAAFRDRSR